MSEFELVDRIRIRARALQRDDVIVGIGDDAAVLQVPDGRQLVVATDTLNAGVHFPLDTAAADIGWKALAVNLSDLAAMGARPAWCILSLSLPSSDTGWLDGFLDGFCELAAQHCIALVGGDTTRGPLSVCVTVHGLVEPGRALRRDGARAGDDVCVTGTLGDAAGALALLGDASAPVVIAMCEAGPVLQADDVDSAAQSRLDRLRPRLERPTPRIDVGRRLLGVAGSAIDLSDGLQADLGHICRASNMAAECRLDALPTSAALHAAFDASQRRVLQAVSGDDYELCFTAPTTARERVDAIAGDTGVAITRIGRIVEGAGVRLLDEEGQPWQPPRAGHDHFAADYASNDSAPRRKPATRA